MSASSFEEWSILEIMGHRRLGGLVTEAEIGGIPLLRIDVYEADAEAPVATQYYGKAAVYCLTPTTEATARALGRYFSAPVSRYELPAATGAVADLEDDEEAVEDDMPF